MSDNPLKRLAALGQSVWYDFIRRDLYRSGRLEKMIHEDGLAGMTSNPTIFQKAIADSDLYDEDIREIGAGGKDAGQIFEGLAVRDVQGAADVFRPVFDRTGGNDGFVSIEVQPGLARDTAGTIAEAKRLWTSCNRPNVMVKIPGTAQGLEAIRASLAAGININITLLFSVERYVQVAEAHLAAMEERISKGLPVDKIRSVASFFVSRVDTNADRKLDAVAKSGDAAKAAAARALRGRLGIANARLAYEAFERIVASPRFQALKGKGVAVQRPLWASTSTKDPALPDLYYVEALIGPDSVDTMPPETVDAYRDHGDPQVRIREDLPGARAVFGQLSKLGIDTAAIFRELEDEGIKKFADSFDALRKAVSEKEKAVRVA
jgi:transaldolase